MLLPDQHQPSPEEFSAQYHVYRLYHVLHHIKALLLYPLNCQCGDGCRCEKLRASILLTLNMDFYNRAEDSQERPKMLSAIRLIFEIPDDRFFSRNCGEMYPLWLIEKSFDEKVTHFKIVGQLVWTLLRLAKTYKISAFNTLQASLKEAIDILVGKMPIKSKSGEQIPYLCGEKAYATHFRTYKSVCHFITALRLLDKEDVVLTNAVQITEFLRLSHWIRKKLLAIETPNVKGKVLIAEGAVVSLPSWVNSDGIDIPLDPFEHKLREIKALLGNGIGLQSMGLQLPQP